MIRFKNEITILRPAEEVFGFLSDFENIPKWNYYVRSVRKVSDGEIGLHSVFHQIREHDEQIYEIIDYRPGESLVVRTRPGSELQFERAFTLRSVNGATELADDWKLDTGRSGLVEKLAAKTVKKAVLDNTVRLKELLETGSTTLQDGRRVEIN
jgi:uncharacterized membrane protein